ncbi:hypothetical protein [Acidovorax sp. LjRoot194]|uniref:hypothetical protein n=1 Tax=Acidovorax sp. LjRoot194 TaxID=3342280 RepID=UPI003ECC2CD2
MPRHWKILYLFASHEGWLTEVKLLDLAADAPKAQVYQWVWVSSTRVVPLRFLSQATEPRQERQFHEAKLWFDDRRGELAWHNGDVVTLHVQAASTLPSVQRNLLKAHFEALSNDT